MKVTLPGNVISIEVARASRRVRRLEGKCAHTNMTIHAVDGLVCADCDKQLNPIGWIIERMEDLNAIGYREKELNAVAKKLDERTRTKCVHCQKMTPVRV
jgi:hypothetical protein